MQNHDETWLWLQYYSQKATDMLDYFYHRREKSRMRSNQEIQEATEMELHSLSTFMYAYSLNVALLYFPSPEKLYLDGNLCRKGNF